MSFAYRDSAAWLALAAACLADFSDQARAHGVVGPRFFPATIATDDPFAADELAFPTVSWFDHETDVDFDYSKTILPGFAIEFGMGHVNARQPGEPREGAGAVELVIVTAVTAWAAALDAAVAGAAVRGGSAAFGPAVVATTALAYVGGSVWSLHSPSDVWWRWPVACALTAAVWIAGQAAA